MTIKKVIKAKGWSLESVRARMSEIEGREVSQPSLSKLVNSPNPTVNTLQRIADAIGCSPTDFFDVKSANLVCPHCGKSLHVSIG